MKVAILYPWLTYFGGADRVIISMAKHFDCTIYTGFYDPSRTYSEIKSLKTVEYGSLFKEGKMRNYEGALKSLRLKLDEFDIINPHMFPNTLVSLKYNNTVWYCHTPLHALYHLRNFFMKKYNLFYLHHVPLLWLDQLATKYISRIICNSLVVKMRIKRFYGREAKVIHPGIDLKKYRNEGFENFILCVGALDAYKRLGLAIAAAKFLKEYDLYIVSGRENIPKEGPWERLRKKATPNVKFFRNLKEDELIDLYARCVAVVHPAYEEDFGLVPLEAMASGKPVIACIDSGGVKETIINGKTGFLTEANPKEIAKAVKKLKNRKLLEKMSDECFKRSLLFSEQRFLQEIEDVYEEVLQI